MKDTAIGIGLVVAIALIALGGMWLGKWVMEHSLHSGHACCCKSICDHSAHCGMPACAREHQVAK